MLHLSAATSLEKPSWGWPWPCQQFRAGDTNGPKTRAGPWAHVHLPYDLLPAAYRDSRQTRCLRHDQRRSQRRSYRRTPLICFAVFELFPRSAVDARRGHLCHVFSVATNHDTSWGHRGDECLHYPARNTTVVNEDRKIPLLYHDPPVWSRWPRGMPSDDSHLTVIIIRHHHLALVSFHPSQEVH